jgi:hypothetical protein
MRYRQSGAALDRTQTEAERIAQTQAMDERRTDCASTHEEVLLDALAAGIAAGAALTIARHPAIAALEDGGGEDLDRAAELFRALDRYPQAILQRHRSTDSRRGLGYTARY